VIAYIGTSSRFLKKRALSSMVWRASVFRRVRETDVAVGADAQDLEVDAAAFLDAMLVPFTEGAIVGGRAGRDVDVLGRDVDVAEKMFVHEMVIRLGMGDGQADVFVEVEGGDVGEIQLAFFVEADQFLIEPQRC
jgi:hypothetical protein